MMGCSHAYIQITQTTIFFTAGRSNSIDGWEGELLSKNSILIPHSIVLGVSRASSPLRHKIVRY